jgi:predicted dehydrogenase
MTILRWGLLSTARINRALIPPLQNSERNRVMAVASRDLATAEAYARERGIPRALGSYEALITDPEIDVIYNPLPNHLHAPWSIRALEAGKHVLCEKPLALSLQEVDDMEAAARASGRVLMEAFMYRHHPQTLRVRELVQSGALGQLQFIRGTFSFTLTDEANVRWKPEWGGGALWDVGCYPVSYARFIAGTEPLEVFGQQWLGRGGVDETFIGQLRFPGDVYAQFDCAFRSPYRTHLEVVGSEGVLNVPVPYGPRFSERITLKRGDQTETLEMPGRDLYALQIENLADAILLGAAPHVSLADSRGNTVTILALFESAREGRAVRP